MEDYASVLLRSATGILGTVEVGNGFPRVGTDGEWKIAGRDAILTLKDGVLSWPPPRATRPRRPRQRRALSRGDPRRAGVVAAGPAPPISVHDCLRAVRLIDQAYALAG